MYLLPRILRAFRAAQPSVELVLDIDATDQICERIHAKQIDLAAWSAGRSTTAACTPSRWWPTRWCRSPRPTTRWRRGGHPARGAGRAAANRGRAALAHARAGRADAAPGLRVQPAIELIGTEAVKKAVEANLGVAFVSAYAIERELRDGVLCRLSVAGLQITRPLGWSTARRAT